jgi:FlaA1/EpsC-like NDP-sugar epimerase
VPVTRRTLLREAVASADLATLAVAFALSYWLAGDVFARRFSSFADYTWLLWVIATAWLVCLHAFGLYQSRTHASVRDLLGRLLRAQATAGLILLAVMYTTHSIGVSRLLIGVFLGTGFALLCAQRLALMCVLDRLRRAKALRRQNVLLVGTPEHAVAYMDLQGRQVSLLADVVGLLLPASVGRDDESVP